MKKSLIEEFELDHKNNKPIKIIEDYDIFQDKELLENLRIKIIQNLIDHYIPDDNNMENAIYEENI